MGIDTGLAGRGPVTNRRPIATRHHSTGPEQGNSAQPFSLKKAPRSRQSLASLLSVIFVPSPSVSLSFGLFFVVRVDSLSPAFFLGCPDAPLDNLHFLLYFLVVL